MHRFFFFWVCANVKQFFEDILRTNLCEKREFLTLQKSVQVGCPPAASYA